jgi:hypothetical protein
MKQISYVLSLILLFNFTLVIYPQKTKKKGFISFNSSQQKITDLSDLATEKCSQTLRKEVGDNFVEVKFQPEFAKEAEILAEELKNVVVETKKLLLPLKIDSIRFYLLEMDDVPENFSIYEKTPMENTYIHLAVFKNTKDLIADNRSNKSYRTEIFRTIPHELTHSALGELITSEKTRWFDEGLADYVGNGVAKIFSFDDYQNRIENYVPPVSLHRNDIRENIWFWEEPTLKFLKKGQKQLVNEFYFYGASYQLIKEIIAEAGKKEIAYPLEILLTNLKQSKAKLGKPAGTPEIIFLIEQHLKVNPKTVGILDKETQNKLVGEALDTLSQSKTNPEKKYFALYTLAGIGEVNLSDKWLNYLLDEVYRPANEGDFQKDLAATALAQRFNQAGFEELLKNYSSENKNLKGKSIGNIKQKLQELSIRPEFR